MLPVEHLRLPQGGLGIAEAAYPARAAWDVYTSMCGTRDDDPWLVPDEIKVERTK